MTAARDYLDQSDRRALASDEGEKGYIAVTTPRARLSRALKHEDTFAVIDDHGDLNALSDGPDGLFHLDTRHLSYLELKVLGAETLLLGSNLSEDATCLRVDLTNPDIWRDGSIAVHKDQLHIERNTYVWASTLRQMVTVTNFSMAPVDLHLTIGFDSDFADLFEVRGMRRARRGIMEQRIIGPAEVGFAYEGLDGVVRTTSVFLHPAPTLLSSTLATYKLTLHPREHASVVIDVACNSDQPHGRRPGFVAGLMRRKRDIRRKMRQQASLSTGNAALNEVLRRSSADLAILMTDTAEGPYPYAGIPWFSTIFGRDGLITAIEMLWLNPGIARGVLRYLARHQATTTDPASDAEPGKILHEVRKGEMAACREVPFGMYYGSVDSTPLFVLLAGLYSERTGDDTLLSELWPNIEAALRWMDGPGDMDRDGFIEYRRKSENGLANQGWKDSEDAVFHADGTLATGPIALVEVQAYAYEAKRLAARAAVRLGMKERAAELERAAEHLKERFERAFWSEKIGCYVLALDGEKRPCEVLSSNAGQALRSGIASPDRAAAVSGLMLGPAFFSGWGIRTIADGQPRFNPMSYHDGSIWPHDNALIATGLARGGRRDGAARILKALVDAGISMDQYRLPELFCGFRRGRSRSPVLYPVACSPQAWASGALLCILQAMLGIEIDGHRRRVGFNSPIIPEWLGYVEISRLDVGGSLVDIRLSRKSSGNTDLKILSGASDVTVELC